MGADQFCAPFFLESDFFLWGWGRLQKEKDSGEGKKEENKGGAHSAQITSMCVSSAQVEGDSGKQMIFKSTTPPLKSLFAPMGTYAQQMTFTMALKNDPTSR